MTTTSDIFDLGYHRPLASLRLIETLDAVEIVEDWSAVRSPSRAARRRRQGHPQRIKITHKPRAFQVGDTVYIHPAMAIELRRSLGNQRDRDLTNAFLGEH